MKAIRDFKDRAILFGWTAGLLIIISIIWIISQPLQTYHLLRTVNNVFINNNDPRRVYEYIPVKSGKAEVLGYWYSMNNSPDAMFVFMVFQDGILIPLGAIVSAERDPAGGFRGEVQELIPLSAHAVQTFNNLPQSILQMYIRRIEASSVYYINQLNEGNIR